MMLSMGDNGGLYFRMTTMGKSVPDVQHLPHRPEVLCSKVASSGDVVTHEQHFAIFDTRVPAYTMPPSLPSQGIGLGQIRHVATKYLWEGFVGGACRLAQHRSAVIGCAKDVRALASIGRVSCFAVNEPSEWLILIDDTGG